MDTKNWIDKAKLIISKYIKLIVLILGILFIGIIVSKIVFSPERKLVAAIKKGDSNKICKLYSELNPEKKKKAEENMYEIAVDIFNKYNEGNYTEKSAWETITLFAKITDNSNLKNVKDDFWALKESKNAYNEAYKLEKTKKERALEKYLEVIESDTYYEMAQKQIQEILLSLIEEDIQKSDKLIMSQQYEEAYKLFEEFVNKYWGKSIQEYMSVQRENDVDKSLYVAIESVCSLAINYYDGLISESEKQNELLYAIELAEKEKVFDYSNNLSLDEKIEHMYEEYFNFYIAKAEDAFVNPETNYADALLILQPIREQYPNCVAIQEKCEYYESFEPVSLLDMEPFDKGTWWNTNNWTRDENITDNTGVVRAPGFWMGGIYLGGAYWRVDKQYDIFKAVVCVPAGHQDELGCNGKVIIYGDGEVLWSQEHMDGATKPIEVKVDISDVDILEIYMSGGSAPLIFVPVCVSDPVVQRVIK